MRQLGRRFQINKRIKLTIINKPKIMNNQYINAVNSINDNYNNLDFEEMNIDFNIDLYNN